MRNTVKDPATFVGLFLAFFLVAISIVLTGDIGSEMDIRAFVAFIDIPSVFIVVFGTIAITIACFSFAEVTHLVPKLLWRTVFYRAENPSESALRSLEIAEIARKNDLLGLEKYEDLIRHNPFLKKGLRMVIDGVEKEKILNEIQEDINAMHNRHDQGIAILLKAAEIAPAMGLIGTLIGLVKMLGNLDDPSTIGPSMAVALLTTFYGALMAYMFFAPIASKLERNSKAEMAIAHIYLKLIESVIEKENPRKLEAALNSMLSPEKRITYYKS